MFALPLLVSALATTQPATYPEGFAAHCRGGREVGMTYAPGYPPPHPEEATNSRITIDIRYAGGQFVVTESGDDFEQAIRDGMDGWTIEVLQQVPGNLVLLTRSSGTTALNVHVYHLQFEGNAGALLASSAMYGGVPGSSSLLGLACSVGQGERGKSSQAGAPPLGDDRFN